MNKLIKVYRLLSKCSDNKFETVKNCGLLTNLQNERKIINTSDK